MMQNALKSLAQFVGAHKEDIVFVVNATTAVNSVLKSVPLKKVRDAYFKIDSRMCLQTTMHSMEG